MINKQILKKAIEKAVKNGWNIIDAHEAVIDDILGESKAYFDYNLEAEMYFIIFSHSFAKAFWGEKPKGMKEHYKGYWKDQLQIMVLEKEPLKCIEKFL